MSHEIRTPINGIIGMTALVAAHADEPERVRDSLRKITSSSRHLLSLINEVLDMSKIESGRISLNEEDQPIGAGGRLGGRHAAAGWAWRWFCCLFRSAPERDGMQKRSFVRISSETRAFAGILIRYETSSRHLGHTYAGA